MGAAKQHQSIRVFQNPLLERLTHVHPIMPLLIWFPVSIYFMWRTIDAGALNASQILIAGLAGFVFWTLTEYILHRFIFHWEGKWAWSRRFHFLIHGLHHDDPVDPTRLVMPPAAAVILAIILYSAFRAILGPQWVDPFFSLFLIGYLCYDYIHFGTHHLSTKSALAKTRFWKMVKQNHMAHHFTGTHSKWGVSSPLWDIVFGTMNEPKNGT